MSEICPICGLPKELCICGEIAKEQQKLTITRTKRKYGKPVTVISGFTSKHIDLQALTKELKSVCACGGTLKNNVIELQGEQAEKAKKFLTSKGYDVKMEEGIKK
ncbi:MAG: stress response translation initiation inhibitor YciH [Candidatus Thermoplasmatota archaeon]|nr:stress response translation initiation inhibitor YciH [Candidatus Thermoplasmatota archaeon]